MYLNFLQQTLGHRTDTVPFESSQTDLSDIVRASSLSTGALEGGEPFEGGVEGVGAGLCLTEPATILGREGSNRKVAAQDGTKLKLSASLRTNEALA